MSLANTSQVLLITCLILLTTVDNRADGAPLWQMFRVQRQDSSPGSLLPQFFRRTAQGVTTLAKEAASAAQTTLDTSQVQTLLDDVQVLRTNAVQLGKTIDTLNSQQVEMNALLATLIKIIGPE